MKSDKYIKMILPENKRVELEGLYLHHNLRKSAQKLDGKIVIANYVSDLDDIIAKKDESGVFQVAKELKNKHDWDRFQELSAQADVIITGAGYLQRFAKLGEDAENVLTQFEKGGSYEKFGDWRIKNGYKSRNPDLAIVSRSLDFVIPELLLTSGRKIAIYTTNEGRNSKKAKELILQGVKVIAAGSQGVNGKTMVKDMVKKGYRVIKMTTGPRVLEILLKANVLDRLYVTRVNRNISYKNPTDVQKILTTGGRVAELPGFKLKYKYSDDKVVTADGKLVSQEFLVYEKIT